MSRTTVLDSVAAIRQAVTKAKPLGDVALVPTMGALHEGHLSLVRAAREKCRTVVASIFVNPMQFGPNEDFGRYPRDLDADVQKLELEDVDFVFAPSLDAMYPSGSFGTFVDVPGVADRLDGKFRPGHFRGVATVVTKLFHIVLPDFAFFGQKDAAQVAVLRAMVRDLNVPVKLIACPTIREPDGLAMSSRNQYLSTEERARAPLIYQSLCSVRDAISNGITNVERLRKLMIATLQSDPALRVEYAEIIDPDSLLPIDDVCRGGLIAIAAWIGQTRLIDNFSLPAITVKTCE